jgi:8-oxo-dGTP pyrophosphatase MutT (NUDIX family)
VAGGKCILLDYIKNLREHIGHERLLLVGASVFVHQDGKLLLQKRKDNGCWGDHGGSCELGESIEETARRELLEETGLIAKKLELLGVFSGKELFYTYPNGDMEAARKRKPQIPANGNDGIPILHEFAFTLELPSRSGQSDKWEQQNNK